ncbi:MAG TPA: hypothetical protein PK636_03120, partial [bacterium]|nr:hypothetical protein [bacterium]
MKKTNPTAFPGLERPDDDRRFPWWTVFAAAFAVRAVLNAAFFLRNGWQASHLIEIWYYYGVAGGSERLSPFDPTFWLLRFPGLFFGGAPLYAAVVLTGVLLSSLTALLVAVWVGRCAGRESGWWAGLVFAFLPAPLTLCLANFSHDLAGLPLTLVFLGAVAAWERGGSRLFWGATAVLALGAGLMVGPLAAGGLLAAL